MMCVGMRQIRSSLASDSNEAGPGPLRASISFAMAASMMLQPGPSRAVSPAPNAIDALRHWTADNEPTIVLADANAAVLRGLERLKVRISWLASIHAVATCMKQQSLEVTDAPTETPGLLRFAEPRLGTVVTRGAGLCQHR